MTTILLALVALLVLTGAAGVALYLVLRPADDHAVATTGTPPSLPPPVSGDPPGERARTEADVAPWEGGDDRVGEAPTLTGALRVTSDPAGASVSIDGNLREGATPISLSGLTPGAHEVELRLEGRRSHREQVTIAAGEEATLAATLRPRRGGAAGGQGDGAREAAAGEGTLAINTRPWSKVYAGSRLLGTTPLTTTVPAGALRLRLEDRDGTIHERTVNVAADETTRTFFDLGAP